MAINQVAQSDGGKVTPQAAAANANQTQPAAQEQAPAKAQLPTTDTVTISISAKAMMQEAQETPAQTAQEAGRGDMQAQRKLSREEALNGTKQVTPLNPK